MAAVACGERSPTALDGSQLPEEPLTLEVDLPWSAFGSNLQVLGGYSTASALPQPLVTRAYLGALEARSLFRFDTFPVAARVVVDGVTVSDDSVAYVRAFLTLGFDTLRSVVPGPVTLQVAGLQDSWHAPTASWTSAVDTVADSRPWTGPGADGPIVSSATWDPAVSDSVTFPIDSADIVTWIDPADLSRGANVITTTDGALLVLSRARLRVSMRSSLADTIVEDTLGIIERTVIYDPPPPPPTAVRIGGVPAWRTLVQVSPPQLNGPPELCAAVGCPYTPPAGDISYAGLVLTSVATEVGYQPFDTLWLDVRPVLSPAALPKSPLGLSETGGEGSAVPPEAFASAPGRVVEVPVTTFMRTLLGGPSASGSPPPGTLAVLSAVEPLSIPFATFAGLGGPGEPRLRMVLTVGRPQVLP